MAASILREAGFHTGLYTSPHLVSFTERIQLDGRPVTEEDIIALAERLKALVERQKPGLKPTFFEFTTAMALDYFAAAGAEFVVLEVGMGGRLDSTNVVTPECSLITNVELEHREYLGDTLSDIAFEKAGIIKPGVPLVTSEKKPEALDIILGVCRENGSAAYVSGRDFEYKNKGAVWAGGSIVQLMDYHGPSLILEGLEIPLAGPHQLENAAAAVCALELVSGRSGRVDESAIREGLKKTVWGGRLEVVSNSPLLVLDGAHNAASVERLAESIGAQFAGRYRHLTVVMGILSDKDSGFMIERLAPLSDVLVLTQAEYERAAPAEALSAIARQHGIEPVVRKNVHEAIEWALHEASAEDMVLVTGSLYVIGEAKAWLEKKRQFLKA
jgi:dihydrofolate synthase/folylpolyglutamate synthase